MATTIKELAEYLGLSIGTISRALRDDPKIAAATRKKVKTLAGKLEYVPSSLGRGLQSRKSKLLGFLVSNIKDSFYDEILQGIAQAAQKERYGVLVGVTDENAESELKQLQFFREKSVEGIIISNYSQETVPHLLKLIDFGTPMVVCDFEPFEKSVPTVLLNEYKAIKLLLEYLTELNHQYFGFYFHKNSNSAKRFSIVSDLLHQKGLRKPILFADEDHFKHCMCQPVYPTAILGYSDFYAVEAIHLLNELNFRVPEDVSVVGFDDLFYASWKEYRLTTIRQPKTVIGELAVNALIDIIDGNIDVNPKSVEPELIIRSSCRSI